MQIIEILFHLQKGKICALCVLSLWLDKWDFRGL